MLRPLFHKLDRVTRIHKFYLVGLATLRGSLGAVQSTVEGPAGGARFDYLVLLFAYRDAVLLAVESFLKPSLCRCQSRLTVGCPMRDGHCHGD